MIESRWVKVLRQTISEEEIRNSVTFAAAQMGEQEEVDDAAIESQIEAERVRTSNRVCDFPN